MSQGKFVVFDVPVLLEAFYVEIMSTGFLRITLGQHAHKSKQTEAH